MLQAQTKTWTTLCAFLFLSGCQSSDADLEAELRDFCLEHAKVEVIDRAKWLDFLNDPDDQYLSSRRARGDPRGLLMNDGYSISKQSSPLRDKEGISEDNLQLTFDGEPFAELISFQIRESRISMDFARSCVNVSPESFFGRIGDPIEPL